MRKILECLSIFNVCSSQMWSAASHQGVPPVRKVTCTLNFVLSFASLSPGKTTISHIKRNDRTINGAERIPQMHGNAATWTPSHMLAKLRRLLRRYPRRPCISWEVLEPHQRMQKRKGGLWAATDLLSFPPAYCISNAPQPHSTYRLRG